MTELGFDPSALDVGKFGYNPNQPRVPAGNGPESGRWEAIWNKIVSWLDEPVPEYDTDTGTEVGTRTRGRAIATNPVTVGVVGTAALLGGEAVAGATVGAGAASAGADEAVTMPDVEALLPDGMDRKGLARLAGFAKGLVDSSQASTEATEEVITNLKNAGVSRQAISLAQRFYASKAEELPANVSASHRAALLSNILKRY